MRWGLAGLLEKALISDKFKEIPPSHFREPPAPQSILPTTCLGLQSGPHDNTSCHLPSAVCQGTARSPEAAGEAAPAYLACAGGVAAKCAGGTRGRAASHRHLSTGTAPRTSPRPWPCSTENRRQGGLAQLQAPSSVSSTEERGARGGGGLRRHVPSLLGRMTPQRSFQEMGSQESTVQETVDSLLKFCQTPLQGLPPYNKLKFDCQLGSLKQHILTTHPVLHGDL